MYPTVRIDKRIPSHSDHALAVPRPGPAGPPAPAGRSPGTLWQRRWGYRLSDHDGLARVYQPAGTPWWNPLGGWTQAEAGIAIFGERLPFVISCHGPEGRKRFYIDVVRWSRVTPAVITYLDLYLDVLIDADGAVTEKDEEQLAALAPDERRSVRAARDLIRSRIAGGDPLFDPAGSCYGVPDDAGVLPPVPQDGAAGSDLPPDAERS